MKSTESEFEEVLVACGKLYNYYDKYTVFTKFYNKYGLTDDQFEACLSFSGGDIFLEFLLKEYKSFNKLKRLAERYASCFADFRPLSEIICCLNIDLETKNKLIDLVININKRKLRDIQNKYGMIYNLPGNKYNNIYDMIDSLYYQNVDPSFFGKEISRFNSDLEPNIINLIKIAIMSNIDISENHRIRLLNKLDCITLIS